jgi:glycosyltransferase involved in cell wall biosynthesis
MPNKLVSVITINFNNLRGLRRTFESIAEQTAHEFIEFIVVDGLSTDGSVAFLQEKINYIDKLIIEQDSGIYDAMNKGLKAATGKYVWFVNSGDAIYDVHTTEKLLPLISKNPGIIYGDTMFINAEGKELGLISKLKPQPFPENLNYQSFKYGMSVCHQSFIAQRELCDLYALKYRQAADIDWILNILKKKPIALSTNFVISAFETGGSSAQNEKKAWKERFMVLQNHYGVVSNLLAHFWIGLRRILFNPSKSAIA